MEVEKLRLVIADDEKVIRDTLANIIDWESYGFEVVALCKNGLEAYDAVVDEYPDILITDIKMPGLSGLELIEKLQQNYDDINFIVLSGFDEFAYAKRALELGVKSYLLKPCNENEIIKAVCDIRDKKNSMSAVKDDELLQYNLMRNLITETIISEEPVGNLIRGYSKALDCDMCEYTLHYCFYLEEENIEDFIVSFQNMNSKNSYENYNMIYVKNIMIIICKKKQRLQFPDGFGQIEIEKKDFSNITVLFDELAPKLKRYDVTYIYDGMRRVPIYNHGFCGEQIKKLYKRYCDGQIERNDFRKAFLHDIEYIEDWEWLLAMISSIITETTKVYESSMLFSREFITELKACGNSCELSRLFDEKFDDIFPVIQVAGYKPFIEKLIVYTNNHISDPNLSLKWISENYLFMNVDYVSKQFMKQTGEKYSNYLNKLRIQKAKTLLLDKEKILDVIELIGCGNNPRYFNYLFKKYEGITPTEYIAINKKND